MDDVEVYDIMEKESAHPAEVAVNGRKSSFQETP